MVGNAAHRHIFDPGGGFKRSKHCLLEVVMLDIKVKGMEHSAPLKDTFCPNIHHMGLGQTGQNVFFFFLNVVMLHIKLKEKRKDYIELTHTLTSG